MQVTSQYYYSHSCSPSPAQTYLGGVNEGDKAQEGVPGMGDVILVLLILLINLRGELLLWEAEAGKT